MPFDGKTITDLRVEILQRARARVALRWSQGWDETPERNHWWQFWRKREAWCAHMALEGVEAALLVLLHALGVPWGDEYDLYEWNDEPDRTQGDVLALNDRAIASIADRYEAEDWR